MDAALAFLACYIQDVWPILQSSLRYVTDPKYFHQTPWSGITSLPISISCIFLRKLKITVHEHWQFDCSMFKLNLLEQNNNKDAEDDAWPLWDQIAYKKKKRVTLFPTQKLGLGGLVLLNHWWSTDQQLPVDLHRQSYCIITLTFLWTCPGLQSKKAILGVFTLCNFQFSQFSELQVSTFLRNIYIRRKVLNKGLIFWFPWTLQQDFKCCWNCQKRKMCVIVLQMIT